MKVVIFTQAYNAEKTLPRTVDSILSQTFKNIEYYILDNGSTDGTSDVILEYAKRDQRVFPLSIDKNNIQHGGLCFWMLAYASNADYIVWCDSDDAYSMDFLEKMTAFASENRLDVAVCGYDIIDSISEKRKKHRVAPENMVLQGRDFVDRFVEYRGFMSFLWAKLYSIPFLRKKGNQEKAGAYRLCDDSIWMLSIFQKAERVGIFAEAMYQYYQYPNSYSNHFLNKNIKSYVQQWLATKQYLAYHGPISKVNEDFLYAIWLSFADESAERIFSSELPAAKKLDLLRLTFAEPLWAETLAREADPQFRNLAARAEYVAQMKERILALASTPDEQKLAEQAVRELEKPIAGVTA